MKALTVQQPWAWAIAAGHKPVENRGWATGYRGPLAIHAGKTWDEDGASAAWRILSQLGFGAVERWADAASRDLLPRGAVVAVAELTDICRRSVGRSTVVCDCGPWAAPGHYHWQLGPVGALIEPVPATGRLGLWEVDLSRTDERGDA